MRTASAVSAVLLLSLLLGVSAAAPQTAKLPAQLTDAEFWRIFTEFSEPGGEYPYENFVTNEETFLDVMPVLTKVTKPGGIYLGVGPEQNFTYIAGVGPGMAFIFDLRRQNAIEHLMYKALFEMSPTRGDFVSHLFSIKSPDKVPATSRANGLFLAFDGLKGDTNYYAQNLAAIKSTLAKHKFVLSADDLKKIEYVYDVFFRAGPDIDYKFASQWPPNMAPAPTYVQAMTRTDAAEKKAWSFLATEENYQVVRELELKNLLIPIVGDFSGPKAVRAVAEYVKQHNATVSAFYLSNVEAYLDEPRGSRAKLQDFYRNASALPVDSSSFYIRFVGFGDANANLKWLRPPHWIQTVSPMSDLNNRIKAGESLSYGQAIQLIPDPKVFTR
jgi:hypothetical protein